MKTIRILNWNNGKTVKLAKVLVIEQTSLNVRQQIERLEKIACDRRLSS